MDYINTYASLGSALLVLAGVWAITSKGQKEQDRKIGVLAKGILIALRLLKGEQLNGEVTEAIDKITDTFLNI